MQQDTSELTLPCDDGAAQSFQLTSQPIQPRPAAAILRPSYLAFATSAQYPKNEATGRKPVYGTRPFVDAICADLSD